MPRVKPGGTAGSFDVNAELLDALIRASPIWNRLANLRKSRQDMTMLRDKIGDLDFTVGVVQGSKSKVQQALARLDAEERILLDSPDISTVIRQLMLASERTCTKMFEDKASSKGFATKQELQRMKEDQGLEVKKLKEDLGKVTGDVKELKHKRTVAMEDGDAPSKKRKAEAEPDSSAPVPNSANLISHTQFKKFKEEIEEESKKRESQANENFLRPYAVLADRVDYSTGVIAGLSRTLDAILKAFIDDASKITINIPNDPQRMIALKEVMRGKPRKISRGTDIDKTCYKVWPKLVSRKFKTMSGGLTMT
jgi:hypothetical protein